MAPRISLALAIHNHQPVGNFGWVFAEVYEQAYEPMVAALERHPHVRLSLHYTGPLLEWLRAERPDFIARLAALVARDQVEILGGGYYEPVLASLPERDRIGQVPAHGRRARGALRAAAGRAPGWPSASGSRTCRPRWSPPATTGRSSTTPTSGPRRSPRRTCGARTRPTTRAGCCASSGPSRACATGSRSARSRRSSTTCASTRPRTATRVGMMGDDGEKFGAWPTTWEHCWGKRRWVDRFFEALDANADWLTTTTPTAWLADHPPIGRVYVPTSSYAEMGEWALPPDESRAFAAVAPRRAGRSIAPRRAGCAAGSGATSRSATARSTTCTSRCCGPRTRSTRWPRGPTRTRRSTTSTRASRTTATGTACSAGSTSATCALRRSEHLIAAEDLADDRRMAGSTTAERRDLDLDGHDEVRLSGPGQVVPSTWRRVPGSAPGISGRSATRLSR